MGAREIHRDLEQWEMDGKALRRRMILAPTPRERWYAVWLLAQGWTAARRRRRWSGTHTPSAPFDKLRRASAFGEGGPAALIFEQSGGSPLDETQREELKAAVQELQEQAGIQLANWYWKGVRQFVWERFGTSLSRSSCLNWLHRLGFAFKRPKKRLFKADEVRRKSFVEEYAALRDGAGLTGGKIFFADEAHFRADADLRGKWVLRGEPALVDSTSPRHGEKASYYSAVCLETGEVEWMELEGNSNSGTSAALLDQLRKGHAGPLLRDLGQRAGAPWRGDAGLPEDAWPGAATGEPAGLQPGLQCR